MSWVTGITIHCRHEDEVVIEIQNWIASKGFSRLNNVDRYYNGSKHPQIDLYGGGYNYFPNEEFLEFVKTLENYWNNPENVVVIINPEEGGCEVYRP